MLSVYRKTAVRGGTLKSNRVSALILLFAFLLALSWTCSASAQEVETLPRSETAPAPETARISASNAASNAAGSAAGTEVLLVVLAGDIADAFEVHDVEQDVGARPDPVVGLLVGVHVVFTAFPDDLLHQLNDGAEVQFH